jgi:ribosomal protein L7/L12
MPQIQVFQCPSCGASLSYEGGPESTVTCQFCGSDVIVPEELRAQAAPLPAAFAPALDSSGLSLDKLAELKRLAHGGQKIEAIKLYRQMFDVGLKEAKDAVEKLEAGEPLVLTSVSVTSTGASADQATRLAEVVQLLRAGQKIEAIKLYRQISDVGLKEAKDAVEAMEAGLGRSQSISVTPTKSTGCVAIGFRILLAMGIAGFVLAMVFSLPLRLSGSYRQALEAARSNPAVVESLGESVEASWWPIFGELSCGTSSCSADYEIPIHGSRASGRIEVMSNSKGAALFNEGTWILDATVIMDDGSTVRLTAPAPVPTPSAIQVTATARAARDALATQPATRDAQSTAASQNATATAEARAVQKVTATAQARAMAQSILATQAPWPPLWVESFADNRRGWPTGIQQDEFIAVTTAITNGKYLCTVNPKQGNSYWNMLPAGGKALADFSAVVNLRFIRGNDDGAYAYGLVFRHANDDYGFFGLQNNGKFRVLVVYHTGIYQDITQSASAIRTQANQIAVRAIGSNFVFQINDQVVWQLTEDMAPGEIGLGVDVRSKQGEAQVEFTDLQVRAP